MRANRKTAWILCLWLLAGGLPIPAQPPVGDASRPAETAPESTPATTNADTAGASAVALAPEAAMSDLPRSEPEATRDDAGRPPAPALPAPAPEVRDNSGFSAFQVIAERNIFNGNRSGQRITSTRSSSQQRSVRVDAFSLVGTMLSGKGHVAFFDGTESDFRSAFKQGQRIGSFEIREIQHAGVRLALGTNTFDLAVGTGMRREDGGLWKPAAGGSFTSSSSSRSSGSSFSANESSSTWGSRDSSSSNGDSSRGHSSADSSDLRPPASSSANASAANMDEVLKRLMEKREKE